MDRVSGGSRLWWEGSGGQGLCPDWLRDGREGGGRWKGRGSWCKIQITFLYTGQARGKNNLKSTSRKRCKEYRNLLKAEKKYWTVRTAR